MLQQEDVIAFYEKHNLTPSPDFLICDLKDFLVIIFDAFDKSEPFGIFVKESVYAAGYNQYKLKFETWEELVSCYQCFMTGYKGFKC